MPRGRATVPAAPFVAWLKDQQERILRDESLRDPRRPDTPPPYVRILSERLGVTERAIYRYTRQLAQCGGRRAAHVVRVDEFEHARVEDMLHHASVGMWEVAEFAQERGIPGWEAYVEDIELEPPAPCGKCREVVTPIDGVCPWCDSVLVRAAA